MPKHFYAELYHRVGIEIRKAREAKGLTQGQLAKEMGISRPAVINMEQGKQNIDVYRIVQIAHATDVPLEVFFGVGLMGTIPEPSIEEHLAKLPPDQADWIRRCLSDP